MKKSTRVKFLSHLPMDKVLRYFYNVGMSSLPIVLRFEPCQASKKSLNFTVTYF